MQWVDSGYALEVQAHLGDTAGSVPDHRNKASHTNLWFPSAYKSYVYTIPVVC